MPRGHGPRLKSRKDKADYENRLRMIARLAIRKITEEEIAMALGIDQATVSHDLDEIRRQNLKTLEDKFPQNEQKELLAEMEMNFNEVKRELWAVVDNGRSPSRIAALRALRELWSDRVDLLLRLGLIAVERPNTNPVNYDEFLYQIEARRKARAQEVKK